MRPKLVQLTVATVIGSMLATGTAHADPDVDPTPTATTSTESDISANAGRYLHNSFSWGSATLDLIDNDFSVCDKAAEGDPVYVVFTKTYGGDGQTVYDGNGSKPGCTTGVTSRSYNYMRLCKSDFSWDTCSEVGIKWQ
ncbi:hypothetical protein ACFXJ8_40535 [Nonomuraea sp. NPDC059194]|uniref:hypothetical protein n=1 Tax=Nonomuraea sp. NPDC059194 TaxID=3346764 RepID=UPI003687826C